MVKSLGWSRTVLLIALTSFFSFPGWFHGAHIGLLFAFPAPSADGGLQGSMRATVALLLLCVKLPVHLLALLGVAAL